VGGRFGRHLFLRKHSASSTNPFRRGNNPCPQVGWTLREAATMPISAMRYSIFGCGLAVLALGWVATAVLDKDNAQGFLNGALQLGGALLICGAFSVKMSLHGIVGAGVLSLLGTARGLGNVPSLVKFLTGDRPRGVAPLLEMGVTLVCAVLLAQVIQALQQESLRRMLERE
jgi:hypothetical protein